MVSAGASRTSDTHGVALNLSEANNSTTGVQGNGVDTANLVGSFEIKEIRGNPVVQLHGPFRVNDVDRWWFSAVNAVDGVCVAS